MGNNKLKNKDLIIKREQYKTRGRKQGHLKDVLVLLLMIVLGSSLFYGISYIRMKDKALGDKNEKIVKQDIPNIVVETKSPDEEMEDVIQNVEKPRVRAKGIYISGPIAGTKNTFNELVELVDSTEVNAMVIDIKNDSGEITYKMQTPTVLEIGASVNYIKDINDLVKRLKDKNIYLIARIVAFKDPMLAKAKPELAMKLNNGKLFSDRSGLHWMNPYKKEVWEYLIEIAREAANVGFDEIQFDYIRFPTDKDVKNVNFGWESEGKTKTEVITEFTKYACEQLKPLGVYVSADVYGTIITSETDSKIVGQDYVAMSSYLDYICPMIYPSHYADGAFGIDYPDMNPYDTIIAAMTGSKQALSVLGDSKAIVRPWLQDFTATWVKHHITYSLTEIKAQIQAVNDAGYEEWILWNGSNKYTTIK